MIKVIKCECPDTGKLHDGMEGMYDSVFELPFVEHNPGECKCTNGIRLYRRGNKDLWLCSCCSLGSDKLIDTRKETNDR